MSACPAEALGVHVPQGVVLIYMNDVDELQQNYTLADEIIRRSDNNGSKYGGVGLGHFNLNPNLCFLGRST